MSGYLTNHQASKIIELYDQIEHPDETIYVLALNACAQLKSEQALALTKQIFHNIQHRCWMH